MAISLLLHAGVITGAFCGMSCMEENAAEDPEAISVFFEILEESMIATATGEMPEDVEETPGIAERDFTEPETAEKKTVHAPENQVIKREISEELDSSGAGTVMTGQEGVARDSVAETEEADPVAAGELPGPVSGEDFNAGGGTSKPEVSDDGSENDPLRKENSVGDGDAGIEERLKANTPVAVDVKPQEEERAKVVSAPVAFGRIVPRYPRSARRRGREGNVTVEVHVSASGEVINAEVIAGSGHGDLDAAAVSAVRSARFSPATEDGVKVHGQIRLTFEFKLR